MVVVEVRVGDGGGVVNRGFADKTTTHTPNNTLHSAHLLSDGHELRHLLHVGDVLGDEPLRLRDSGQWTVLGKRNKD